MIITQVKSKKDLEAFYNICKEIYKNNIFHRSTEDDITRLLIEKSSVFHHHASVNPYLIMEDGSIVGRFALIYDQKLPDYVQVSFFEALPGLLNLAGAILRQAKLIFPGRNRIVVGLNGHLNYGAGILVSKFDQAPVFGLSYSPEYYQDYFKNFTKKTMVSFRFPTAPFFEYYNKMCNSSNFRGITVRKMNKKKLRQETEIYTYLNNACFPGHPYWADRTVEEDFELFYPFRFLIKEENLLFAEMAGKPIGFFLWYPDFNQLVNPNQHLGLRQVLRYHCADPINTFRFTEIAVLPKYKISPAVQAMILYATPFIKQSGYHFGEGGFIFEENKDSMAMTRRFLERATGEKIKPYRRYAVFESEL